MFIGHFAVAFATKKVAPKASLGTLVVAAAFLDVLWPVLVAIVYQTVKGDRAGAVWVGIAVASHWVLDCVSHRPDMPLYPGGAERLGLGLWQSLAGTFAVEGLMFAAGVALYI